MTPANCLLAKALRSAGSGGHTFFNKSHRIEPHYMYRFKRITRKVSDRITPKDISSCCKESATRRRPAINRTIICSGSPLTTTVRWSGTWRTIVEFRWFGCMNLRHLRLTCYAIRARWDAGFPVPCVNFSQEEEAQREREYCAARHEGERRVSHHRMTMVQRKGCRV